MKWSILILTQPSRTRFLARLMAVLKPQIETNPLIEVNTRIFDKTKDLGTNRQKMIEEARGEYLCFIDDDDLVPAHYVKTIFPLLDGVDYIGFQLQYFMDGVKQIPTYHSLRYKEWNGDKDGWYRNISHLNPIRKDLAIQCPMDGGSGEDYRWAECLKNRGVVKSEHYIDDIMYFYYWRSSKTDHPDWQTPEVQRTPLMPRSPECSRCGSTATGLAGGMRRCNQCGHSWI